MPQREFEELSISHSDAVLEHSPNSPSFSSSVPSASTHERSNGNSNSNGSSSSRVARGVSTNATKPAAAKAQLAGTKRARSGGTQAPRRSIFRVGSRRMSLRKTNNGNKTKGNCNAGKGRNAMDDFDDIPGSPRARASTYSHVKEAVMYNLSEAERSRHDQSVPMGVIGLRNLGNTCFINSSLQCLSATIPLADYFLGYDYRSEINEDNFLGTGGKLATAYAELMKQMWLGQKSVVEPRDFKRQLGTFAPQFNGFHQHDAQELLAFLLDGIHEDLNRVKKRPYVEDKDCDGTNDEEDAIEAWKNYLRRNKSLVVDLFQGQLRNTLECLSCGHRNIRFEPFMYLSLPITPECRSIQDCINLYLQEETLKDSDQWYCGKCKKHRNATKKSDLWIMPPILIVHLKRFKYNDSGKVGYKNNAPINYPVVQWDLSGLVRSTGSAPPVYDLYAVSNHMGGTGGGHYTALGLNRFNDEWYDFNDSKYHAVDASIHKQHTKSAYLLFYNRSEGDSDQPLYERSPLIRRQSVSRPDLWPHRQVAEREKVRDFTRSHRRSSDQDMPDLDNPPRQPPQKGPKQKMQRDAPNNQTQSQIEEVRRQQQPHSFPLMAKRREPTGSSSNLSSRIDSNRPRKPSARSSSGSRRQPSPPPRNDRSDPPSRPNSISDDLFDPPATNTRSSKPAGRQGRNRDGRR